jgi:hypothetical protein
LDWAKADGESNTLAEEKSASDKTWLGHTRACTLPHSRAGTASHQDVFFIVFP